MIKKTIKKKKKNTESQFTISVYFHFIFIMPIFIKFSARRPKGLDRSVYNHSVVVSRH